MEPAVPELELDEFELAELDARRRAAAEGMPLGVPPSADALRHLAVIE